MTRAWSPPLAALLMLPLFCASAHAAPVNFSDVNSALVSSPGGQTLTYVLGVGTTIGTVNVRLISGDLSGLTTGGGGPDPYGFYALQNPALTPILFRFTFDQPRGFVITSNETLTPLETNTFSLPLGGSSWSVLSATNCTVNNAAGAVSFAGITAPPYGQFALSATGVAFDFLITNTPGYLYYGSALSLDVVDQATSTQGTSWGQLKARYQ